MVALDNRTGLARCFSSSCGKKMESRSLWTQAGTARVSSDWSSPRVVSCDDRVGFGCCKAVVVMDMGGAGWLLGDAAGRKTNPNLAMQSIKSCFVTGFAKTAEKRGP